MARSKASPLDQPSLPGVDFERQPVLPLEAVPTNKRSTTQSGPPNLGQAVKVTVPVFSDPKRPKTCLEVDFPIVPINAISQLEGNAGRPIYQMSKWWARRRGSVFRSILLAAAMQAPTKNNHDGTQMLDAEGIPVPDETEAARAVWEVYYANHQKAGNFENLKVLDCFMGGGTTLVEGSRLGFQVTGVDLNPVAWFVVKNELACTDPEEVRKFFARIEAEVKPAIQPFYVTDCPRGHIGRWFRVQGTGNPADDELMPVVFDPLTLLPEERKLFRYEGPEVIYTFWAKHGPCSKPGCGHRTPIFRSPVIAEKKLGVKYLKLTCKSCKIEFHAELGSARMAPGAERIVLETELPFTELTQPFAKRLSDYSKGTAPEKKQRAKDLAAMVDSEPGLKCPICRDFAGQFLRDVLATHCEATRASAIDKKHLHILPPRNGMKHVNASLLVDPIWLKGSAGNVEGGELGGYSDADPKLSATWYKERLNNLRLIEVRGQVALNEDGSDISDDHLSEDTQEPLTLDPEVKSFGLPKIVKIGDGTLINTRDGTVLAKASFTCQHCGLKSDILEAIKKWNGFTDNGVRGEPTICLSCQAIEGDYNNAPLFPHALQGYCLHCAAEGYPYSGRFFSATSEKDIQRLTRAEVEWNCRRSDDLSGTWPKDELPHVWSTHAWAIPEHGYTHWYKMFNSRQLLIHGQLVKSITTLTSTQAVKEQALGAFQQYLRNQNMFCIWNMQRDTPEPFFSNPYMRPRQTMIEANFVSPLGRGNWSSCTEGVIEGLEFAGTPFEFWIDGENQKVETGDRVNQARSHLECRSSTDLPTDWKGTFDLVISDPPFGENITYADLADFFYVWLRDPLKATYPDVFSGRFTPQSLEAISNPFRNPDDPSQQSLDGRSVADRFYCELLTSCWDSARKVLKDSGMLAFTFHHKDDDKWVLVLESLFDAGFVLEATYPVFSDESKGDNAQFGSQKIEYDIIHVCRKRLKDGTAVSWAKMRQWVRAELTRLKLLLAAYRANDLSDADIQVILRGKALEFYSRHYGKVFTSAEESMPISHALAGINQLLEEGTSDAAGRPPSLIQPTAYQYLRLFTTRPSRSADDVTKSLFGTTIRQKDFEDRAWVEEKNRVVRAIPVVLRFERLKLRPRKEMKTEIDQAHFLMGGALPNSGINLEQELSKDTWMLRRSVDAVLEWYSTMAPEQDLRNAATLARTILRQNLEKLRQQPGALDQQLSLFNDWEDPE